MGESKVVDIAIGIDLGTTNSRVAIWLNNENRFELIENDHGNRSTASYVAFTGTECLIGDSAKNQVWKNPTNTIFDLKRVIGRTYTDSQVLNDVSLRSLWPFRVARDLNGKPMIHVEYKGKEKVFFPEEVYAMVLRKMKDLAEVYMDSVVNACISVTVPSRFNFAQTQAVRNACTMAGFEGYTLVSDHSCAASAYLDSVRSKGRELSDENVILFFDLGGGTLGVTLVIMEEGIIEVKATSGDSHLGGEDFDLRLLNHVIEKIKLNYGKDVTCHPRAVMRLKKQVERVKLALSSSMEATIQVDSLLEGFDFEFSVTRSCFEEVNMDLFRKCIDCVEKCLRDAYMSKQRVQEVVLIGGSSRIPKVQQRLVEFFENESILNKSINPDEAVVCGAVVQNAFFIGNTGPLAGRWDDFLVLEVTPWSLGLETAGGVMAVMVSRNTTVPILKDHLFTTYSDNQLAMLFKVYEGERARTRDNALIAIFELRGIPPASHGVPQIRVRFDIDARGHLIVSATDEHSGQKLDLSEKDENFIPQYASAICVYEGIETSHSSETSSSPPSGQYPTPGGPNDPPSSSRAPRAPSPPWARGPRAPSPPRAPRAFIPPRAFSPPREPSPSGVGESSGSFEDAVKQYRWDEVQDITNGLNSTKLGKGGFGTVYLGKLSNGEKVAVKVLDESSEQGTPEFVNEVNLLRSVNHGNLVRLLGYCEGLNKVLIYEFAEEGSLSDHLHGGKSPLDWKQRLSIALQSACGIEYLHTGCRPTIYHRDIKSENILITGRMVAKVADFGISKVGFDQDNTHVTTVIKGSFGYLDPEYLRTGHLTDKSDVYSFGVLLLEIITGRKPIENSEKIRSVIDWVNKRRDSAAAVADPFFAGNYNSKALKHVLNVAKQCTQASGADRPVMKKVVRMLEAAQAMEDEKKPSWPWSSWT